MVSGPRFRVRLQKLAPDRLEMFGQWFSRGVDEDAQADEALGLRDGYGAAVIDPHIVRLFIVDAHGLSIELPGGGGKLKSGLLLEMNHLTRQIPLHGPWCAREERRRR